MLETFYLDEHGKRSIGGLLTILAADERNFSEAYFLDRAGLYAHDLPFDLKLAFQRLKLHEESCGILVTNNPVEPVEIGPTPSHHASFKANRKLSSLEMLHGMYASLLGEPFGFDGQQDGRVFNDLIPIQGMPGNSSSGAGDIGLHTEDSLRPFMPDYLGLCCLRNEESAVTTYGLIREAELPAALLNVLMHSNVASEEFLANPARTADRCCVLFGALEDPYLQLVSPNVRSELLKEALTALRLDLSRKHRSVVLKQGDALYLDNLKVVHGRTAYEPRYDGTGRWFSRLIVTRDLRRTRSFRSKPGSRVMLRSKYEPAERESWQ